VRLTQCRDREHRIGHAYFARVKDEEEWNRVFRFKIVPLLQEFFYNDWDNLRFALGESGTNGVLIRALQTNAAVTRGRTQWQWWFDALETEDDTTDLLATLTKNYRFDTQ